jgi:hypothetical protein
MKYHLPSCAALMLVITTAEAAENEAPIQVSLQSLRQKTT